MRLWTIQPIEVYDILKETGEFICDPSKSPYPDLEFRDAYDWLKEKMQEKIPKPNSRIKDPIWAWYRTDWLHKRPNKRFLEGIVTGSSVLIELEIDDSEVLLSDYNAWHCILNKWPIDDSRNEKEWEAYYKWYDKLPNYEKTRIMKESWNKVFDITPYNSNWTMKGCYVQATFWHLKYSNVKRKWNV